MGKTLRIAGKRDEFWGDVVDFDSYHEPVLNLITAADQKIDVILINPMNGDANWNAVW